MDPRELLSCAQDKTEEGRRKLTESVSSFFSEQDLNEIEQSLASEILLNLLRQAERDLREMLAERLSVEEGVPPELIVYLANDEISVAKHVLKNSPILTDVDLIYIITAKGKEHWREIATREKMSPIVADRLIDTKDPETVLNLIDNERVNLQRSSLKKIVKIALKSEELQAPLLRRPEVDMDVAIDLYMIVSEGLRQEILTRFKLPQHVIEEALENMVHELSHEAKGASKTTEEMVILAKRFKERGDLSPDLMIKTLRRGQSGFFVALFAQRLDMDLIHVTKILQKEGGNPFVAACRYMAMMKSEFASIFLLSRGMRTGDKIVDQRELARALKTFDSIKDHDVKRIVDSWRIDPSMI